MKDDGVKQPPKTTEPVIVQDVIPVAQNTVDSGAPDATSPKPESTPPALMGTDEPVAASKDEVVSSPVQTDEAHEASKSPAPEANHDSDEIVPNAPQNSNPSPGAKSTQDAQRPSKSGGGAMFAIGVAVVIFLALAGLAVYSQIK